MADETTIETVKRELRFLTVRKRPETFPKEAGRFLRVVKEIGIGLLNGQCDQITMFDSNKSTYGFF